MTCIIGEISAMKGRNPQGRLHGRQQPLEGKQAEERVAEGWPPAWSPQVLPKGRGSPERPPRDQLAS
jgi:hypothetical protein